MNTEAAASPPSRVADLRATFGWSLLLTLVSWLNVQAGIYLGRRFVDRGPGYPGYADIDADLFRFDAFHYKSIVDFGYIYNGDPLSGPNIVFAPMFPLLVRVLSAVSGLNSLAAGFLLNKVLLFCALAFLCLCLGDWIGRRRAVFTLAALVTAAGSYAFHAYYSESTFLFFLGLSLLGYSRGWWAVTAVAAAALGASRLTGMPIAAVFAVLLCLRARSAEGAARWRYVAYALVCFAGAGAYLTVIGVKFGNPFTLLDTIQRVSWGRFHPDVDWVRLVSGGYLFQYWRDALSRGARTALQIPTCNLLWTTLGLFAFVYLILAWRRHVLTYVFVPYFLFIYATNTTSLFLIAAHRYFTLMIPIFVMFTALHGWLSRRVSPVLAWGLSAVLLLTNCAYGMLHTAGFNQGAWLWF